VASSLKIKEIPFIFETVHTHLILQEDATSCFVTDVEVGRAREGKIQTVDDQKQGAGKKIFGLNAR
jgi:hypothetical protein